LNKSTRRSAHVNEDLAGFTRQQALSVGLTDNRSGIAVEQEKTCEVYDDRSDMSRTATYHTTVNWKGEHWGHIVMGNGPEMDFSAPPDAQGHPGVFTPEDAFVAAANTCVMMMFIWAAERFKLNLISYECRTEGTKLIELDRTEIFTHLRFWPLIKISAGTEDRSAVEARTRRALQAAQKYSLVANSVKSQISVEPTIEIVE
jgi:organic hydroperoxide reductase OsmC/OhrA